MMPGEKDNNKLMNESVLKSTLFILESSQRDK